MRTHRRDSVHVLAVTRAVVLEICSRRRFIFKMSTNRGKGKNNSFSMIFFFFFSSDQGHEGPARKLQTQI